MTTPRGYYDLQAILQANRDEQRAYEAEGIPGTGGMTSCPNCGGKLEPNPRTGQWHCEMGDYVGAGPGNARR